MKSIRFFVSALFLLAALTPCANAETVILQTGWEDGEWHGLENTLQYPAYNCAGYFNSYNPPPECGRRYIERVRSGEYSLLVAGYSQAQYSYCYYRLFELNRVVQPGMKIGYWIYHVEGRGKIAVDGHFTDGTTLRDLGNHAIRDQYGVPIHPAWRQDPMNQWHYVEVDLAPAVGKTIDFLMFAFDNGNQGYVGPYRAYVDDFRVFVSDPSSSCPREDVPANRWRGEYFDNMTLSGQPKVVKDDTRSDGDFLIFNWELGSPHPCIPSDRFSARWTREVYFPRSGNYTFTVTADDGVRVWVDRVLKVDAWWDQPPTAYSFTIPLTAGYHTIVVEYYENRVGALLDLRWTGPDSGPSCPNEIVPVDHWRGEYFDNRTLSGPPAMIRNDGAGFLDFPWDLGSPHPCIPSDQFSVRWTRTVQFSGGRYEFTASVDDGFRLFIDGQLLKEAWVDQPVTSYSVTVDLTPGPHTIVMEYYENGGYATAQLSWREVSGPASRPYFYTDPLNIPTTPGDDEWYEYEAKSVEQNRNEIALVVDPSNGDKAQAVREHLARGGRVVLLVCGLGNWGTGPSGWERPIATYANDYLDAVVLRVNYGIGNVGFIYQLSFSKGVDRVTQMVLKARKAGSNRIRLYGHSEGSDVSAKVVAIMASPTNRWVYMKGLFGSWYGQGNPDWFEGGFGFGNPADVGICTPTVPPPASFMHWPHLGCGPRPLTPLNCGEDFSATQESTTEIITEINMSFSIGNGIRPIRAMGSPSSSSQGWLEPRAMIIEGYSVGQSLWPSMRPYLIPPCDPPTLPVSCGGMGHMWIAMQGSVSTSAISTGSPIFREATR
jgi:hypothetical protein